MTEGPILSNLIRFAVPLTLTGILQFVYNAADIVVVGRFEGSNAVASVGATSSLINLIINVFMGLSIGTSVAVAQYAGAGRHKDVRETVHTSLVISVLSGAVLAAFGLIFAPRLLQAMGTPKGEVLDGAAIYMRIFFIGMPFNMLYNFGAAILRAVGDTKRPLCYLLVAGLLNIVLNVVFVVCFKMHVAGVALATIVSQLLSAVLVVLCLYRSHGSIQLHPKELRINREKLWRIARVGLPAGLQSTVFSISNVLIQSSINSFGAIAMAGNTAASNMENFVYICMNSLYQSALSFTGQNMGAGRYDRIPRILRTCVGCVLVSGVVVGGLSVLLSRPLLSLYVDSSQSAAIIEKVLYYGQLRMRILCLTYFLDGLMEAFVGVLRGMGHSLVPMLVTMVGVCCVRIVWIYTVFAAHRSLDVLYLSYPISWAFTAAAHGCCYLYARKKLPQTSPQQRTSACA